MPEIRVWTKQNRAVLDQLAADGRFIADEWHIRRELEETTDIMLFIYRWLAEHVPTAGSKPTDVSFPVWVSLTKEAAMLPEPGYAVLELSVDESLVALIDTAKWTMITNYSYIPSDREDAENHRKLMSALGISDARAVMTQFYPEQKEEIIRSWDRLFDGSVSIGSTSVYGLLWEVKKEWIVSVTENPAD